MGNSLGLIGAAIVSFGVPSALVTFSVFGLRRRLPLGVTLGLVLGVLAAVICLRLTSGWLFVVPPHPPDVKFGNGPGLAALYYAPVVLMLYVFTVMWAVVLTLIEASFIVLGARHPSSDDAATDATGSG